MMSESKEVIKKYFNKNKKLCWWDMLKGHRSQIKELQMAKAKQQTEVTLDFNQKHKVSTDEFILI